MKFFSSFVLLGLSCVYGALASPAPVINGGLTATNASVEERGLDKRYSNARMTYYEVGLGACGETNNDSQYVVALNADQYGNGEHCKKKIKISYGGKTATATIVDKCPGCPYAGLDLSPSLFKHFAPLDKGVITGSWNYA